MTAAGRSNSSRRLLPTSAACRMRAAGTACVYNEKFPHHQLSPPLTRSAFTCFSSLSLILQRNTVSVTG